MPSTPRLMKAVIIDGNHRVQTDLMPNTYTKTNNRLLVGGSVLPSAIGRWEYLLWKFHRMILVGWTISRPPPLPPSSRFAREWTDVVHPTSEPERVKRPTKGKQKACIGLELLLHFSVQTEIQKPNRVGRRRACRLRGRKSLTLPLRGRKSLTLPLEGSP